MVIYASVSLFMVAGYAWLLLHSLGYHGVFSAVLSCLWFLLYWVGWVIYDLCGEADFYEVEAFSWGELGNQVVGDCAMVVDFLGVMLVMIMSGGSLAVTSFVYLEMWEDKEGANFMASLVVFLAFMMLLTNSGNLLVFYLGWEGIGLTSLFLMNFWVERVRSFKATFKVFTVNKVGDFLITVCLCLVLGTAGTADFDFLHGFINVMTGWVVLAGEWSWGFSDWFAVVAIIGGGVKSSQYGFHIWLLEAMEAPLGASALMHSSTLVIAGIVLVFKLNSAVQFSGVGVGCLILWGCWTAGFAAYIACFQYELKIVLAYSTVSSMGFIYCLLGLNTVVAGLLYLVVHAFTKIFLFLVVGMVMFHCLGCQDTSWMGGFLAVIPALWVFLVGGALAMSGLPYWGGYYCKASMWASVVYNNWGWWGSRLVVLVVALATYLYLSRVAALVFGGEKSGQSWTYGISWMSLVSVGLTGVLALVVLFLGSLWGQLLVSVEGSYVLNWQGAGSACGTGVAHSDRWGWGGLMMVYSVFALVVWCLWYTSLNRRYRYRGSWFTAAMGLVICFVAWLL